MSRDICVRQRYWLTYLYLSITHTCQAHVCYGVLDRLDVDALLSNDGVMSERAMVVCFFFWQEHQLFFDPIRRTRPKNASGTDRIIVSHAPANVHVFATRLCFTTSYSFSRSQTCHTHTHTHTQHSNPIATQRYDREVQHKAFSDHHERATNAKK